MNLGVVIATLASGQKKRYFVLQQVRYNPAKKRGRTHYVAYVGESPVISEEHARQIAKKIGCSLEDLCEVRGLTVQLKQTPKARIKVAKAAESFAKLTKRERQMFFTAMSGKSLLKTRLLRHLRSASKRSG